MITITEEKIDEFLTDYSKSTKRNWSYYMKLMLGEYANEKGFVSSLDKNYGDNLIKCRQIINAYKTYFLKQKLSIPNVINKWEELNNFRKKDAKPVAPKQPLIEKIKDITDSNHKLILHLYFNYSALRADVFLVKYQNFTDEDKHRLIGNEIVITKTVKTSTVKKFTLTEETMDLIDKNKTSGDFIIRMNVDDLDKRRENASKTIMRLTEKYLGTRMGINDIRKSDINDYAESIKDKSTKEQNILMIEKADKNNHSHNTQQSHYMKKPEQTFESELAELKLKYNRK